MASLVLTGVATRTSDHKRTAAVFRRGLIGLTILVICRASTIKRRNCWKPSVCGIRTGVNSSTEAKRIGTCAELSRILTILRSMSASSRGQPQTKRRRTLHMGTRRGPAKRLMSTTLLKCLRKSERYIHLIGSCGSSSTRRLDWRTVVNLHRDFQVGVSDLRVLTLSREFSLSTSSWRSLYKMFSYAWSPSKLDNPN